MTLLRSTVDEAMAEIGHARTLQTLQAELVVTRSQIAGFQDHERELLDLIQQVEASI
jgi:hypothetical protein